MPFVLTSSAVAVLENQFDEVVWRKHWLPAIADTGFRLRRLDDEPKAGLNLRQGESLGFFAEPNFDRPRPRF
jgi:hypothetical protein